MDDETPSPTVRTPIPEPPAAALPPPPVSPPPVSPTPPPPPEPTWAPPPPSRPADRGRTVSIVVGFVILAAGLWFFADLTLGLDLPSIRWSQFWPVILIVIGGWIVLGTIRRDGR